MNNSELLRKADLAIADIQTGGAIIPTEQARSFIRKLVDQPTMIKECRTVGMAAPTQRINKIGIGSRILHAVADNTALSSGQRSKPTLEYLEMTAKQFKAELRIPYEVMEDNIESATAANNEASNTGPGGLRATILALIAQRAAYDIELTGLLSDTSDGDADYATQDGWLAKGYDNGNVVDHGSAAISKTLFKNGAKALPDKYLREKGMMRHFISHDQEMEYRDTYANRMTALGDQALSGSAPVGAYGVPIQPMSAMPNAKGMFTNPKNLIFGVWRQISLEFDKDITAGTYIIVMSCRICFQIEEAEAVVEYVNIG
jgi:hypothetical protein